MRMPIARSDLGQHPGSNVSRTISAALDAAIDEGRLAPDERLPTVRGLAAHLGVSPATIAAAYDDLARRGRTRGEVGRGTFVRVAGPVGRHSEPTGPRDDRLSRRGDPPDVRSNPPIGSPGTATGQPAPWRRRMQSQSAARLLAAYPRAVDCASGGPDVQLLPLSVLKRAWSTAITATTPVDLQYATAEPIGELADAVALRLARDGIEVERRQIAVGASALQLIELSLRAAERRAGWRRPVVAVEQPGYATVLDAVDRLGWAMVGVSVDAEGVEPESLAAALQAGARLVVLTPRSQNPTGASWSPRRRAELADVLAAVPDAVVVEDDHAADAVLAPSVSLFTDARLRSRVVHVRSFSKAIAPDLRVAVAVAGPSLRGLIVEEKGYVDGWTSRLAQRALARVLRDPELASLVSRAGQEYAVRRRAAEQALARSELIAAGGSVTPAADGMNVWIGLPPGVDETAVLDRVAAAGWVAAPGECFHLRPGSTGQVRLTVSGLDAQSAADAGAALGATAAELAGSGAMVGCAT